MLQEYINMLKYSRQQSLSYLPYPCQIVAWNRCLVENNLPSNGDKLCCVNLPLGYTLKDEYWILSSSNLINLNKLLDAIDTKIIKKE